MALNEVIEKKNFDEEDEEEEENEDLLDWI